MAGCACEGRYVGLFDPHTSSPHPDSLQGLPLQGSRRRATDCAGVASTVALMAEDARASPDVFDTAAAALCSRCDAQYQLRIAEHGCTQCAGRLAMAYASAGACMSLQCGVCAVGAASGCVRRNIGIIEIETALLYRNRNLSI